MRSRSGLVGLVTIVVVVLLVTAGCTSGKRASGNDTNSNAAAGAPSTTGTAGQHAQGMDMPTTPPANLPPEQRALQFDQYLGEHALLSVRQMRSVISPVGDSRQAALAALQANTDALSQLVAQAYGGPQGSSFQGLWEKQSSDLAAYAQGAAGKDSAATGTARNALLSDAAAYGTWLGTASKGRVQAAQATATVRAHTQDLMKQADAYAAQDYDQAYAIERQAYERMFASGVTLAAGSVTPQVAAGYNAPTEKLRAAFAMLLGEHLEMIVEAQRAAFASPAEFKAAGAQVNANTSALTQAMAGIVGAGKAREFQQGWADHVDGLMAYTAAAVKGDDAAKLQAVDKLNELAVNLAVYFSHVVDDQKAVVPLTGAVTQHDSHLTGQVDAFESKDYAKAAEMASSGYQQMLGVSNTLVNAIQKSVKAALPVGGSQTGGGGMARERR